jgi:hypothetical protein
MDAPSAHLLRERQTSACRVLPSLNPLIFLLAVTVAHNASADDEATKRAVAYLVQEVPAWQPANNCFSCHNNGDGARALLVASRAGFDVPEESLAATRDWLALPEKWDHNGGEGDFVDQRLAWVQFGAALTEAVESSQDDRNPRLVEALQTVARTLADVQDSDGSWTIQDGGLIGSPVTWGRTLTTVMARRTLRTADATRFAAHIARADEWLRSSAPRTVLDSAALLMFLNEANDPRDADLRAQCVDLILKAQSPEGGWGPYVISSPEPFDTAVVLLALTSGPAEPAHAAIIAAGRSFLLQTQQSDGSWQETTRPSGLESYAQHMSTCAWATFALVATSPK